MTNDLLCRCLLCLVPLRALLLRNLPGSIAPSLGISTNTLPPVGLLLLLAAAADVDTGSALLPPTTTVPLPPGRPGREES